MAFSKSLPKGQIPVGCQLCKGFDKIVWKCIECNLLMCDGCKIGVHLRIAKDHKIVNIQKIGGYGDPWDSFVFGDVKCQDHTLQSCSLYCKTCSKVICLKCIVKVHNGHTFVDEEELYDRKEKLKDGKKKVERNLSKLSSENEKRISSEEIENPKMKRIQQNILDQKIKIHKAVDQYADSLAQDVVQHFKTLEHEEINKKDKEIKAMHLKKTVLENIITSRDFMKFFRDFDHLNVSLMEEMSQESTDMSSLPNFVPGEFTGLNFGKLEGIKGLKEHNSKVELKVTDQWTTGIENIHFIGRSPDSTLWIADNISDVLQHIALEKDNVQMLSRFNIQIFGLSVDKSSNIIVSTFETRLQVVNERTLNLTDFVFDISPFTAGDIHITQDQKVIISTSSPEPEERYIVIVMDRAGKRLTEYENDSNNKPLFTTISKLTSTSKGDVCVVDTLDTDFRGRVVVIGKAGNIKGIYTGHPGVNTTDKPFTPLAILATPSDNILVADWKISVIHILNSDGEFISYCCICNIGIQYPHSLALSTQGKLFIGCGSGEESPENYKAKLYEVEYSGV